MAPQSEADAGYMGDYDPNLGLGQAGYEKATTAHAATIIGHLKSVGMTPASPGAKQVADGIHKAAMDRLFNPDAQGQPAGPAGSGIALGKGNFSQSLGYMTNNGAQGNANSTTPGIGTSSGYMVPPRQ